MREAFVGDDEAQGVRTGHRLGAVRRLFRICHRLRGKAPGDAREVGAGGRKSGRRDGLGCRGACMNDLGDFTQSSRRSWGFYSNQSSQSGIQSPSPSHQGTFIVGSPLSASNWHLCYSSTTLNDGFIYFFFIAVSSIRYLITILRPLLI